MKKLLTLITLVFLSSATRATNYYVKKSGNDAFSGLSIASAWQTLTNINSKDFNANDSIFFEGGSVFNGNIYLSEEDSGTATQPIFISSYGTGTATIFANKSFGLYAYNTGGIHIHKLNFEGLHPDSSKNTGVIFYTDNPLGIKYKHIWLSNLNVSGFKNGIQLGSYDSSYPGYSGINMINLNVFNNLQDGINTYDISDNKVLNYAHDSLFISHCYLNNNGSSGLVLGGVNGGTIERVKASRSGHLHNKGVVGIWAWNSKKLTFQFCIADSTKTDGGDGGGFDIDGGTENCIIQYCYSFFNDGPGYMHCDYPKSRATQNNTIRYNISEYDGQQPYRDKSSLMFISWGTGIKNCLMYNNTSVIGNKANGLISGLQGIILDDYDTAPKINNCKAFNNIVYANGDSNFLIRVYNGKAFKIDTNALQFAYNVYYASNSSSQKWGNDFSIINNINSWRISSKQEIFRGKNVGWEINPQIKNPGVGGAIPFAKIDSLEYLLSNYSLLKSSPIIDSGMNLIATMGIDIGKFDFFKNASLFGYSQDIGCHEVKFLSTIRTTKIPTTAFAIYPNPCSNNLTLHIEKKHLPSQFKVVNLYGQTLLNGPISKEQQPIDMSAMAPGSYVLLVENLGQKTVIVKK
jgi:hypothetical protein